MRSYRFITKLTLSVLILFIGFYGSVDAQNKKANDKIAKVTETKKSKINLDRSAKLKLDNQVVAKKRVPQTTQANANNKLGNNSNNASNSKMAERCSTNEAYQRRLQDPAYLEHLRFVQNKIDENANRGYIPCDGGNTIVIPIAVHFDASFDCSNVQCLIDATEAQIVSLNDDFAAINADLQAYADVLNSCGGTNVASDGACLTFCLANQNHPAASGLSDGQPAITIGQYNGGFGNGGNGAPEWPGYLNIFAAGTGAGGVADGIPGALNGDGVTVTGGVFGGPNFGPCSSGATVDDGGGAGWDLGRTLTHEVGHYLGLYHVWGDVNGGGCGGDDMISDTPDQATSSFGCTADCATLAACNAGEFVQYNFMDYFDDPCLVMFSNEQAIVMNNFANAVTWANDVIDTGCSDYSETCLVSCSVQAAFSPADGANITLCADEGSSIFIIDASISNETWNWTFTVTSGDLSLSSVSSTSQTPNLTVEGGTSGTVEITLEACGTGACGGCETLTQTYNVTVVSGAACPDDCDYTLELTDTFGDGWNGATLDIQSNGQSIMGSPFGNSFTAGANEVNTIALTAGETITFNQTNGGFPGEEGFILTDPFGNILFDASGGGVGSGEVYSFLAYCVPPTCDDGIQNQSETGIDCGGPNCPSCPTCPAGNTVVFEENFDSCMQPAGWTISSTGTATVGNGIFFDTAPDGLPSQGAGPSPEFSGCIAMIDDDFADNIGVSCIISPVIDITSITSPTLTFDWQHEAVVGGGEFLVQVWDGSMWVTVFSADDDSNGTNETVAVDVYANPNFQVQFCYDDEGGFQWAAGVDNVGICGEGGCAEDISGSVTSGDPSCDVSGIDVTVTAPDGTMTTVTTGADGTFTVPGGPFPCGDYSATITTLPGDLPACYAASGSTGPIAFAVDGNPDTADGPFFTDDPMVPTLSQWGLISLALLLMIFGSLKLALRTRTLSTLKK